MPPDGGPMHTCSSGPPTPPTMGPQAGSLISIMLTIPLEQAECETRPPIIGAISLGVQCRSR